PRNIRPVSRDEGGGQRQPAFLRPSEQRACGGGGLAEDPDAVLGGDRGLGSEEGGQRAVVAAGEDPVGAGPYEPDAALAHRAQQLRLGNTLLPRGRGEPAGEDEQGTEPRLPQRGNDVEQLGGGRADDG